MSIELCNRREPDHGLTPVTKLDQVESGSGP